MNNWKSRGKKIRKGGGKERKNDKHKRMEKIKENKGKEIMNKGITESRIKWMKNIKKKQEKKELIDKAIKEMKVKLTWCGKYDQKKETENGKKGVNKQTNKGNED